MDKGRQTRQFDRYDERNVMMTYIGLPWSLPKLVCLTLLGIEPVMTGVMIFIATKFKSSSSRSQERLEIGTHTACSN